MTAFPFTPVPSRRHRHDGWTPERQHGFIEALAAIGLVSAAAAAVGKSRKSAYALRDRADAESFVVAWDDALALGSTIAEITAVHRAVHGVAVPIFYRGRQVGERRMYDDRLLATALRRSGPAQYRGAGLPFDGGPFDDGAAHDGG